MHFEQMKFCYPWRDYQARVLGELEQHLDDDHLHVVAAPGSGKTVLGLEVMRRLGKSSLIFAPTRTIRDQWVERIKDLFLPEDADISWISKSIYEPAHVTVITYQALHAAWTGGAEEDPETYQEADSEKEDSPEDGFDESAKRGSKVQSVLEKLRQMEVKVLVLDEAHHLRTEWWKVLNDLKTELEDLQIVALTATPPYDVESTEWARYEALNGPIDTIIQVPELVSRGDLCPHQDFVYFSLPTRVEAERLAEFRDATEELALSLCANEGFLKSLHEHPWVLNPFEFEEEILSDPSFYSSILITLHAAERPIPWQAMAIIGAEDEVEIPELDAKWLQTLLTDFVFKRREMFPNTEECQSEVLSHLKRIGAVERNKIMLSAPKEVKKILASSLSKLESIVEITKMEQDSLGTELRLVVLSDYIRKDQMPQANSAIEPLSKMGVVPIFETMRRANIEGLKLGILTGSLIVIPATAKDALRDIAHAEGFKETELKFVPMEHDPSYVEVRLSGQSNSARVHLITELFCSGGVTALVGTQALLGEGWDAPVLNTLILASFVGSYMLSNQMRGRAIRSAKGQPDKAANVWHLVAVKNVKRSFSIKARSNLVGEARKIYDPFDPVGYDLGPDLEMLKRRFRAFSGPSFVKPTTIETGMKRLGLPREHWTTQIVNNASENMLSRARNRKGLRDLWAKGLETGTPAPRFQDVVRATRPPVPFVFQNTISMLLTCAGATIFMSLQYGAGNPYTFLAALFVGIIISSVFWWKAIKILLFNGTIEGQIRQVGRVVLDRLCDLGKIRTGKKQLKVEVVRIGGFTCCKLLGGTHVEEGAFLQALEEALGPVDNPRYLVIRKSKFLFMSRVDYHTVPKVLSVKKKDADAFARLFSRYVSPVELVYTRNNEGRRALLKARSNAMSTKFVKKAERHTVWS